MASRRRRGRRSRAGLVRCQLLPGRRLVTRATVARRRRCGDCRVPRRDPATGCVRLARRRSRRRARPLRGIRLGRTRRGGDLRHGLRHHVDDQAVHRGSDRELELLGQLRVGDRIGAFFRHVPADKRAITVHELLTHTSGLVEALGGRLRAPVARRDGRPCLLLDTGVGTRPRVSLLERRVQPPGGDHREGLRRRLRGVPGPAPVHPCRYDEDRLRPADVGARTGRRRVRLARPSRTARRSTTRGLPMGRTGTCAATAVSSPPRATCSDGTSPSRATRSSTNAARTTVRAVRAGGTWPAVLLRLRLGDSAHRLRVGGRTRRRQRVVLRRDRPICSRRSA